MKKLLLVSNLESVFMPELWEKISEQLKIPELSRTTRDTVDTYELMKERLDIIKKNGISFDALMKAVKHLEPYENAKNVIEKLKEMEVELVIISDTFWEFVENSIKKLGITNIYTNHIEIKNNEVIGFSLRICGNKDWVIKKYMKDNIIICVGDGYNDISMLRLADIQILFNPVKEIEPLFPYAKLCSSLSELPEIIENLLKNLKKTNKILVTDPISERAIEMMKKFASVTIDTSITKEALLDKIEEYDALIVRSRTKVDKAIIEKGKNLKVIGRGGTGVDNIDLDSATEKGIIVLNSPESNARSVAEHTIGLIISLARRIPQANSSTKSGKWEKTKFEGTELYQKKLAIIGLGRIGSYVAKIALALGMNVIAYDPYLPKERFSSLDVKRAETIESAIKEADIITIHTPKIKEMIGGEQIKKMKKGVLIVNCARGGIINELALY
ncbi:MAG: bifunctional phosphoserine phosphatase/homoserine phosphotransferase ThrH, partial [Candidatus Thermoplasmatota archaeon]